MNLRRLDLNLLLVFDTVYSTRSNTKAADKLGLTQSAVSNALRRLREHLDDPLFVRQGQDFVPTGEANRLAPVVRDALKAIEETIGGENTFDPVESNRTFKLVMPDSIEATVLPLILARVSDNGYGITIQTAPLFGIDTTEALHSKEIDLAFLPHTVHTAGLKSAYLFDEDPCIVLRKDHPVYGEREAFTLADMSKAKVVTLTEEVRRLTHIESEMQAKGIERRIICTVSRLWSIPHIVSSTDLVAALPKTMAEAIKDIYGLKILKLPLERPTQHWHMIWSAELDQDSGLRWLRNQISGILRQQGLAV